MEYFICDMTVAGVDAEFYLNDIPLSFLTPDLCEREAMPVNHLLVHGENRLSVLIKPGATPAAALAEQRKEKPSADIHVCARLGAYPPGAIPGEHPAREITQLEIRIPKEHETTFPDSTEVRFQHAAPIARWRWQGAPRLTLDDALRTRVHSLLTQISESLQSAQPELFLQLASHRFEENCIAFEEDAAACRDRWAQGLQQLSQKPNWEFSSPSLETMSLRLCADARMIDCRATDWNPIIRARKNGYGIYLVHYPLFLSNIEGKFQIIR